MQAHTKHVLLFAFLFFAVAIGAASACMSASDCPPNHMCLSDGDSSGECFFVSSCPAEGCGSYCSSDTRVQYSSCYEGACVDAGYHTCNSGWACEQSGNEASCVQLNCDRWRVFKAGCTSQCTATYTPCTAGSSTTTVNVNSYDQYICVFPGTTVTPRSGSGVIAELVGTGSESCTTQNVCPPGENYNAETEVCEPPVVNYPVCGVAQGSYAWDATTYRSPFCEVGSASPSNPQFPPSPGTSRSWDCLSDGQSTTCTATRANCPRNVNG